MKRPFLTVLIIFGSVFCWVFTAHAVGKPTTKLKNRYFTHPKAADIYIQNDKYNRSFTSKRKTSQYYRIETPGKIYTTLKHQKQGLKLKGNELRTIFDDKTVLISGPRKGRLNGQQ